MAVIALLAGASCALHRGARPVPPEVPVPGALSLVGAYLLPESRLPEMAAVAGEVSGAWYDEAGRRLLTVIDRRDRPSMLTFDVTVEPEVRLTLVQAARVEPALPGRTLDLEGIAPGRDGHVFLSSEGEPGDPASPAPGVFEYTRTGTYIRSLHLPAAYMGLRPNLGFEGLTATPDGRALFTAVEGGLRQDGAQASASAGALTRILRLDPLGLEAPREWAYRTEPIPALVPGPDTVGDNGVPEILALGDQDLLVLERAYVASRTGDRGGNAVRIFRVHLDRASAVTGRWSLQMPPAVPLTKTLVLDLASIAPSLPPRLAHLENFEAMSLGPRLADGRRTVLLLSDNNGSARQVTALVVLAWGEATPGTPVH